MVQKVSLARALEAQGFSPEDAKRYEGYVEAGLAVATIGVDGVLVLRSTRGTVLATATASDELVDVARAGSRAADNVHTTPRIIDDILPPTGGIPTSRAGFDEWASGLSADDVKVIWENPRLRTQFKEMIRLGGQHEWCACQHYDKFTEWGLSLDDVRQFSTATDQLRWTVPDDIPSIGGQPGGHVSSPGAGPFTGSTRFHNELSTLITNSPDLDSFYNALPAFVERWKIDPALLPPRP